MTQQRERMFTRAEVKRVDEELVCSIPEPEFTKTWRPYSHKKVIQAVALAFKKLGLKVKDKVYSLTSDGGNMFGLWSVGKRDGMIECVGFRNSIVKKLSIGFCWFFTNMICTNQLTPGKFFLLRKHTATLTVEELGELATTAVEQVVQQFDDFDKWLKELKNVKLADKVAESLTIQAMRAGVLAPKRFKEFDQLLFGNGGEPTYEKTLFGFHGTLTQLIREHNLNNNVEENQRITRFINEAKVQLVK
jgi:hypothetical protein